MKSNANCERCREGKESFTYMWGVYEYDVDLAWDLVGDGREAMEVEEESVVYSVEESIIDPDHVEHVDTRFPGLIAHIQHIDDAGNVARGHVLIDGHHRAARCLNEKKPFFAYLLNEQESERILLKSPAANALSAVAE